MNKLVLSLAIIGFSLVACTEKSVEPITEEETPVVSPPEITLQSENKPVFFDYTSTGCPGCGSWGAPTFEAISDVQKNNIVPVAVHIKYGDPMISEVSNAIAANRTGQYFTPQLWVNNTNSTILDGGRINGTESVNMINSQFESFKSAETDIQAGVSSIVDGENILIRYKTKANIDLDGEYYVGVYLMENGIIAAQSSSPTDPTTHNHVIRDCQSGSFGQKLTAEDLSLGSVFEETHSFTIKDDWNMKNLYATIIVWKKVGSNYIIVNSNNNLIQ